MVKLPFWSTVPSPIIFPLGSLTITFAPGSPLPLSWLPSLLTTRSVGAFGANVSGKVTGVSEDSFPDPSVKVTVTFWPLLEGSVNVAVPSPESTTVPITSPAAL